MSDVARGSLTPEEVAKYTDALTRHHGERVAPVSEYCRGFERWQQAITEKVERLKAGTEGILAAYDDDQHREDYIKRELELWEGVLAALATLYLPIYKSNLLSRLIYGGEPLRTKVCPRHKGLWSGCHWEPIHFECGCGDGCNVTGWVKE